jgi:hypothetical protein
MPFKVQVGPHQVAIHQGQTVLVSEPDGQINWPSEKGLYFFDTRLISSWRIYANGEPWDLLNGGEITYYASRTYLTNHRIPTTDRIIAPRTLGLIVSRLINGGVHEDLDITNYSMKRVRFQLEIALRCDFADVFEVKSGGIVRRGRITTEWSQTKQELRTVYRNRDFVRAVTVAGGPGSREAGYANGRLSFEIDLEPGAAWHCCLLYTLQDGERSFPPPNDCADKHEQTHHAETLADWLGSVLKIHTSNEEFYRLYRQGAGRYGGAAAADRRHGSYGVPAGRRTAVVRGPIRPRQPDRLVAEPADLPGFRARRARHPGLAAGEGAGRLP